MSASDRHVGEVAAESRTHAGGDSAAQVHVQESAREVHGGRSAKAQSNPPLAVLPA